MKQTRQNSTPVKKNIKTVYAEYYDDMFTLRQTPVSKDYLLKFALEWVNWAMTDEDALKLTQFYVLKGIHNFSVERWMKRCPELQRAHDWALMIIGNRREIGAIKKIYDSAMIRTTMCMYDTQWKELEEWRARLSEKIASAGGVRVVEIPAFGDADLLPKKEKK